MKAAVYFGSREIYYDMVASYKSLLVNSDVDKIYLLIEDNEFPFELHPAVETINISKLVPTLFNPESPNYGSNWTYIGLIRSALTKVFPQLDRILSIDCDTVVLNDISELWDIDLDDYYVAGVKEPVLSQQHGYLYINAGVTMWNLKKLREDCMDDQMIYSLNVRMFSMKSAKVTFWNCRQSTTYHRLQRSAMLITRYGISLVDCHEIGETWILLSITGRSLLLIYVREDVNRKQSEKTIIAQLSRR